jgi:hypothetical protein
MRDAALGSVLAQVHARVLALESSEADVNLPSAGLVWRAPSYRMALHGRLLAVEGESTIELRVDDLVRERRRYCEYCD